MNVYTNEQYLKEQLRRARRLRWLGVGLIFLSFFASFGFTVNELIVCLAYPLLFLGFPLWMIGQRTQRQLEIRPRADELIDAELKGLSNKYALYHYVQLGERVLKHVLVSPNALIVIEANDASGPVAVTTGKKGESWRSPLTFMDRLGGTKSPVGNPTKDLAVQVETARNMLRELQKPQVPVEGLIVFTRNPDIRAQDTTYEALPLDELRQTVRDIQLYFGGEKAESGNASTMLTAEDRRRINALLRPAAPTQPAAPTPARKQT